MEKSLLIGVRALILTAAGAELTRLVLCRLFLNSSGYFTNNSKNVHGRTDGVGYTVSVNKQPPSTMCKDSSCLCGWPLCLLKMTESIFTVRVAGRSRFHWSCLTDVEAQGQRKERIWDPSKWCQESTEASPLTPALTLL